MAEVEPPTLPQYEATGSVQSEKRVALRATGVAERDPDEPDPRRRLIFAIVAIGLAMSSIDSTIVSTALRPIGLSLGSKINWTTWSVTIYQLGQMVVMPLAGKVSDQFGRKKVYLVSTALFTAASVACGLSTSVYMLIGFRFLQSLGGGAFMPSAVGIVSDHFGRDRDRALGMFASIMSIGVVIGPVFGGVITQSWSWRGIFYVNVPLGIALLLLVARFIPVAAPRPSARLDVRGVSLVAGAILFGMYAITNLGSVGLLHPRVVIPLAIAVLFGWGFVRHTKRDPAPFIPLDLLIGKGFLAVNTLNFLYGTAIFGFGAIVPLYAENRYHIGIADAGTLLSARGVGMICIATVASMQLRRTGYRLPLIAGFGLIAIALVMLAVQDPAGFPPYLWLALWSLFAGLGMGVAAPAANNAILQLAPDRVAQISGLRGTFRMSGGILYLSAATAALARSRNPGITQAHFYVLQAIVLVLMMAVASRVPDHKGRW